MSIFKKNQTLFNSTENCCPDLPANNVTNFSLGIRNNISLELNDGTVFVVNLDDYDDRWEYPTPSLQSFIHTGGLSTVPILANKITGYFIQVMGTVTITEINCNVTALGSSLTNDILFGIYSVDNGYPNRLICQSPVLNVGSINIVNSAIVGGIQILNKGIYFVAHSSNSDSELVAAGKNSVIHIAGHLNTLDIFSFTTGIIANYVYNGTLPTFFPAGGSGVYADIPMAIFQI